LLALVWRLMQRLVLPTLASRPVPRPHRPGVHTSLPTRTHASRGEGRDALPPRRPAALEHAVTLYRGPFWKDAARSGQWRSDGCESSLSGRPGGAGGAGAVAPGQHGRGALAAQLVAPTAAESAQRALMQALAPAAATRPPADLSDLRVRLHRELTPSDPETEALFERLRLEVRASAVRRRLAPGRPPPVIRSQRTRLAPTISRCRPRRSSREREIPRSALSSAILRRA